jgi:hypothetical protein
MFFLIETPLMLEVRGMWIDYKDVSCMILLSSVLPPIFFLIEAHLMLEVRGMWVDYKHCPGGMKINK